MKKWFGVFAFCCLMLTGCHMNHEWQEATCTTPKTCTIGGETEGEPLGHTWVEATCSEPKHCSVCGEIEGEPLAHTWIEATCSEPKHCSVCGEIEGEPLGHTWIEANYQQPAICEICGETEGEPLQADFEKEGLVCEAELNRLYPYTTTCTGHPDILTTGSVLFSNFKVFESDEEHEALDGYEWQTYTVAIIFEDDNAWDYGVASSLGFAGYYEPIEERDDGTFTLNYNGEDYTECTYDCEETHDGWEYHIYTLEYCYYIRVPIGYDGIVAGARSRAEDGEAVYCRLTNNGEIITDSEEVKEYEPITGTYFYDE